MENEKRGAITLRKVCKAVPLAAAVVCLAYNVLTITLCLLAPQDPLDLTSHMSFYALAGCGFSIIGAVGVLMEHEFTTQCFAQFVLADAFIGVIARMFLEEFIVEALYTADVCGLSYTSERWSREIWRRSYGAESDPTSVRQMFNSPDSCGMALVAAHATAVAIMILTSVVQVSLAISVQRYAKYLEVRRSQQFGDDEEESSDDEFTMPEKSVALK